MQDGKEWERLSLFESHDFVEAWYKKKNGRSLNAQRVKEITSCFTQGREYFSSAETAAKSVRPLLLYYGVLALSRGTILLRSNSMSEASLKPSHGLEAVDWSGTLSAGISAVLDIKIRANSGTFSEFVGAVDNVEHTGWWDAQSLVLHQVGVNYPKPKLISDGTLFSLEDLLSREQGHCGTYKEIIGKEPRVHPAEIVTHENAVEFSFVNFGNTHLTDAIANRFGWSAGIQIYHRDTSRRLPISNFYVTIPAEDMIAVRPTLPMAAYRGGDFSFVIEDFHNGDRLTQLYRTYMISYILGMLVRYFPSKWMALLRNEKGDAAMPLLVSAMNAVESDFPKGISEVLA